jgi:hypothetical protein
MSARELTRRQILSCAAAAGLGCVLRLPQAGATVSPSSAPGELTPQRRRIYEALVAAVVAEPAMRLDPVCANGAAAHFAGVYVTWSADARERAGGVLDVLERGPHGTPFSRQSRAARASFLRECTRVTSRFPCGAERERLALAEAALTLVAVAVGPGEDGERGLASI